MLLLQPAQLRCSEIWLDWPLYLSVGLLFLTLWQETSASASLIPHVWSRGDLPRRARPVPPGDIIGVETPPFASDSVARAVRTVKCLCYPAPAKQPREANGQMTRTSNLELQRSQLKTGVFSQYGCRCEVVDQRETRAASLRWSLPYPVWPAVADKGDDVLNVSLSLAGRSGGRDPSESRLCSPPWETYTVRQRPRCHQGCAAR